MYINKRNGQPNVSQIIANLTVGNRFWLPVKTGRLPTVYFLTMGIVDTVKTGRTLKLLAMKHGYSAESLSVKLGFSRATVFNWFAGDTIPRVDTLAILATMFGVKIDDLVVYQKGDM